MKPTALYYWRYLFVTLAALILSSCGDESLEQEAYYEKNGEQSVLSEWEVARLLFLAGFKPEEIHTMICIAQHESHLRPDAIGYATASGRARNSRDIGLFQINSYWWARPVKDGGCGVSEEELFDPEVNSRCAHRVFERHGFSGWVAFKKHETKCRTYLADLRRPQSAA